MIIVIRKQSDGKFVANVDDPTVTFMSDPNPDDFGPFRNGIIADGNTWGEALENIKRQINEYISVYNRAKGELPEFADNGVATIISENTTLADLLK